MLEMNSPWLEKNETLICFGDSITASSEGYVKILQERLAKLEIKVINAGRGGDKTTWGLTRFQQDVLDKKPDAVSIYLGANDAAVGRGTWADEPVVPPEVYKYNLIWMMHLGKLAGIKKWSINPPAWRFEGKSYAEFGDIMAPYCRAAREAADYIHARFAAIDIAFAEEWNRHPGHTGLLLTRDGVHMTEKGNSIIADTMIKTWCLNV